MPLKFDSRADKHHVPRRSSWYVAMTAASVATTTNWGQPGRLFIGADDRGIELEVITVQRGRDEVIVHSMPTANRHTPK